MMTAAGVLFIQQGRVLLLQRGPGGDMPGTWAFPGGKLEDGETPAQAAARECVEEMGAMPEGKMKPFSVSSDDVVEYTTFIQPCTAFNPTLNDEHTGFTWAEVGNWPQPMHPGAAATLERLTTTEMDVACGVRDGYLASPTRFSNVSMFAMRITGTGTAFRSSLNEYVWRDPDNYLTPEFLARCLGLPVICEHPDKASLDSVEFADRVIGTIMLSYIVGDEVWGVARIYDDQAVAMLTEHQLSTSPTVVFSHPAVNSTIDLADGSTLLIEGRPILLDHLAICERGVWDKAGDPLGVRNSNLETGTLPNMTEAEKLAAAAADKARKDAEDKEREEKEKADAAAKADADAKAKADDDSFKKSMLSFADDMGKRMDALEAVKSTPEEVAANAAKADKARKDADEKTAAERKKAEDEEAEREKAEREKADADTRARLDAMDAALKGRSDAEEADFAKAQAKADSVMQILGGRAPRSLAGEALLGYRKRLAGNLKAHSPAWKDIDITGLPADAFGPIEAHIYADALAHGSSPASAAATGLRAIVREDATGRKITEYVGHPDACFSPFKIASRRAKLNFNNAPRVGA